MKIIFFIIIFLFSYISNSQELIFIEIMESEIQPFELVEKIPITKNCKPKLKPEKLKKCVQKSIRMHFAKKFNTDIAAMLGLTTGTYKIETQFIINEKGRIINIEAKSNILEMKEEAIRVINLLPQMIPGEKNNHPVNVKYKLPFTFRIE